MLFSSKFVFNALSVCSGPDLQLSLLLLRILLSLTCFCSRAALLKACCLPEALPDKVLLRMPRTNLLWSAFLACPHPVTVHGHVWLQLLSEQHGAQTSTMHVL